MLLNRTELSVRTRYIIRDIGMYIGKMFVLNHDELHWDYHTNNKQDSFANMPQIFGFVNPDYDPPFEMQFEPVHFVEMEASNLLDHSHSEHDLYDMYFRWHKWIPSSKL